MSELDKFFKDKLRDRTFEFKDTYWDAAEQLIEQEQEKKRKRGGFWWWTGTGLLLLFGVISYFVFNGNTAANISNTNTSSNIEKTTTPPIVQEQTSNKLLNKESTTSLKEQEANQLKEATANNNSTKEEANSISKELTSGYQQSRDKGVKREFLERNPLTTDKNPVSPSLIDSEEVLKIDSTTLKTDTSTTKRPDMALIDEQELEEAEPVTIEMESIAALNPIQTVANELELPEAECEDCFDFGKVKRRTLNYSAIAEGIVYPFEQDASWWTGGSLGLGLEYAFNRKFSIRSGLQYAMVRAVENSFVDSYRRSVSNGGFSENFDEFAYASYDNQYGFGLRRIEEYQLPKTIHYVELPLLAQLRFKRHKIEAGVHWNFLIGARGRALTNVTLYPWEQDQLGGETDMITSESVEWLPKDDFRKVITNATIGYRYRVTSNFSLALNTYFRLGASTLSEERLQFSSGNSGVLSIFNDDKITPRRLHFRLGAQWHF